MKLNKYFMLGLAGLAFAACSNEEDPINGNNKDQTLVIKLAGITSTRTSGQWAADTDAKENIASLTLLFTDANGVLKYAPQTVAGTNLDAIKGDGIKYVGVKGVTAVHAIANKTVSLQAGANISALNATLAEQTHSIDKATEVIYVGSDTNINPIKPEPSATLPEVALGTPKGNFYYAAEINLMPSISRIQITKITVKTSGEVPFPATADGTITKDKFKLSWSNFKPQLHGVYLNNFSAQSNLFQKTVEALKKNTTYLNGGIANGEWKVGGTNYATDAAYIKWNATDKYGALLNYAATPTTGNVDLEMPAVQTVNQCLAFNIFIPFDPATGTATAIENPTIHFQFAKDVNNGTTGDANKYTTAITLKDGGAVTEAADKAYIATAKTGIDYTLPTVQDGGYLFANVSKLLTTQGGTTTITLEPAKIYNMEVIIDPINMTIDLDNPETYNVVVKVTVEPFTVENIYPGMGE